MARRTSPSSPCSAPPAAPIARASGPAFCSTISRRKAAPAGAMRACPTRSGSSPAPRAAWSPAPISSRSPPRAASRAWSRRSKPTFSASRRRERRIAAPYPIPRDSLTPVVQRLVRDDLPSILRPGRPATDRGRSLEDQWATLDRSFKEIAEAERVGRAPSIIVSPMLVESGAPAFFTNLDLGELRERSLGLEERTPISTASRSSCSTPSPRRGPALTLATAVRLNATFPYVSPAVSLPTIPAPARRRRRLLRQLRRRPRHRLPADAQREGVDSGELLRRRRASGPRLPQRPA
jgi:hypothetical protein